MPTATLLMSAMLVIAFDQATKGFVAATPRDGAARAFGPIPARRWINRRPAPGGIARWCVELALLVAIVQFVPAFGTTASQVALGAAAGGVASNPIDRARPDASLTSSTSASGRPSTSPTSRLLPVPPPRPPVLL